MMDSDLLDEYCRRQFGHTDWEVRYHLGNAHITMYAKPRPEYLELQEEFYPKEDEDAN